MSCVCPRARRMPTPRTGAAVHVARAVALPGAPLDAQALLTKLLSALAQLASNIQVTCRLRTVSKTACFSVCVHTVTQSHTAVTHTRHTRTRHTCTRTDGRTDLRRCNICEKVILTPTRATRPLPRRAAQSRSAAGGNTWSVVHVKLEGTDAISHRSSPDALY